MKKVTTGLTLIALTAMANQVCLAQSLPPVRQLGSVTAVAKEPLAAVSSVRHLPDGRVLVNDIIGRRGVMFDSALATTTVVADTTSATASAYGTRPGGLIAYHGDSTLFIDPASLSMLLIDPGGKIVRVMSAPRAQDVGFRDSIATAGSCIARRPISCDSEGRLRQPVQRTGLRRFHRCPILRRSYASISRRERLIQ